jgi:molybdenum cofactor guanylyltransferase
MNRHGITGILMAGGKSSRMGRDKGLMFFRGRPMARHVLDPMAMVCQRILVSANDPAYGMFGFELVKDEIAEFGPVGGLMSALRQSDSEMNLVLSCDIPLISHTLLVDLLRTPFEANALVVRNNADIHPLIGVYRRGALAELERAVREGEHKLKVALERMGFETFEVADADAGQLMNMNTPQDIEA